MTKLHVAVIATIVASAFGQGAAASGDPGQKIFATPAGAIVTPGSSIERPEDLGRAAHTNVHLFRPARVKRETVDVGNVAETPASLACLYGVAPAVAGCNPQSLTAVAKGGSRAIAIVDAYDYPTAIADLSAFSAQYGLPAVTSANFSVVYASGTQPIADPSGGWALEAALDIEMAHSLAPGAKVILVEAASNSYSDLFAAEQVAAQLVSAAGGGEVSNSWSGGEFSGEMQVAPAFSGKNVVFFASAGDTSGTGVPSALPNVVSVGGTTINRDGTGNFINQTTWASTGGGLSPYVTAPAFQQPVATVVGNMRGTPDVSLVANPASGVWVYDTTPYDGDVMNWVVVGGTSVASPAVAALVNNAGAFRVSTTAQLNAMYGNRARPRYITDITGGSCPNAASGSASIGYDLCTGIGTPLGRYAR